MAKLSFSLVLMIWCSSIAMQIGGNYATDNQNSKMPTLRLYVHDRLSGPNQTVYQVASSSITTTSPTYFGLVNVFDNLITAQPDPSSVSLGRVQGFVVASDLKTFALTMDLNFWFTTGKFNGSTLSVVGRNQGSLPTRELPVVGGTGVYRGAYGYAIIRDYSPGVIEYTFYTNTRNV